MKFYVYIHFTKDELVPFYIGKGKNNRKDSIYSRNKYWKNKVAKHGFISDILKTFEKEEDAFLYEKEMIQFFKSEGFELCNLTDGGEGLSGLNLSESHKIKIGNAMRGKPSWNTNSCLSTTHKDNIRSAQLGNKYKVKNSILVTNISTNDTFILTGRSQIIKAGFNPTNVYNCINGKAKYHRGYTFEKITLYGETNG